MPASENSPPSSSTFTSGIALVGYLALIRFLLYLFAGPHYGYFRDELYYLACGQHPAWGYVDQPPLIGWMAWLLQHTIGTSLYALRLLPVLADVATMFLTAKLARDLGGGRWAMFLAALAVLAAPIFLALTHLFTMNAFDPLLWTLLAWLLVRLIQTENQKLWIAIGAVVGVSILNKYGILFLLPGLLLGMFVTPLRRSLARPWFWMGTGLAVALALPNFLWQRSWGYPFLHLLLNIRQGSRDVKLPPLPYLANQAQMIGFVSAPLVVLGLWFLFSARGRRYVILALGFLSVLGIMMALKGKFYYVAPVYPIVFAPGAVLFEQFTQARAWRWMRPMYATAMLGVAAVFAPTVIPILPIPAYISYTHKLGIQQQKFENQPQSELPQIFADMVGWENRVRLVANYFHSLPPEEQKITAIGAPDYGEAGAVDFFGPKYGLPKSISDANNYWIWGPRNYTGASLILMNEDSPEKYVSMCQSLTLVAKPEDPDARPDSLHPIYHCRGLKMSLKEIWPKLRAW